MREEVEVTMAGVLFFPFLFAYVLPACGYLFGSSFNAVSVSMASARGAGHPLSLLMMLPSYAGQFLAGVALMLLAVFASKGNDGTRNSKKGGASTDDFPSLRAMALPVALHVASNAMYGAAISMAGSALYQVCYASSPVFSIVYTKLLLGKSTPPGRIFAVIVIISGLVFRVHVASSSSNSAPSSSLSRQPLYGALATFACAAGFSLGNILAERALNPPRNSGLKPVKAHGYLTAIGGYGLLLGSVCNALWTFPRWNELVGEPMRAAGQTSFFQGAVDDSGNSTSMSVAACFFINMLSSASLNLCYYILVVRCGVVTMAVLSAMNTVIVSLVSHLLFCESSSSGDMNDNAQCITPLSAAASAVVLAGVLLYASMAPPKASKSKTS